MRFAELGAAAVIAATSACAPNIQGLIAKHQYAEALCATNGAYRGDKANAPQVEAALEKSVAPQVHVQLLSKLQLQVLVGEQADALHKKAIFMRTVHAVNKTAIPKVSVAVSLHAGTKQLPLIADSRSALAKLTGEKLPMPVTVGPHIITRGIHSAQSAAHEAAKPFAILGGALIQALTLGILPWVTAAAGWKGPRKPQPRIIKPNKRDYACRAPKAETLYQRFVTDNRDCSDGKICTTWSFYERPPAGTQLTLVTRVTYLDRVTHLFDACSLTTELRQPLADGDPERALRAIFGSSARTLASLREAR